MESERTFLRENDVVVTISRVIVGGTTYPTGNITSVSKRVKPASTGCANLFIITGIVMLTAAIGTFFAKSSSSVSYFVVAAVAIAIGIVMLRAARPTYLLIFSAAGGETEALASTNQRMIDRVLEAINDALVARG